MRAFVSPRRRCDIDKDATALDAHWKGGDLVGLEAGLAETGAAMKLPTVPRADDVILFETAVAERTAHVIARIRQRAPGALAKREGDVDIVGLEAAQCRSRQFVRGADIDPVFVPCHDALHLFGLIYRRVAASHRDFSNFSAARAFDFTGHQRRLTRVRRDLQVEVRVRDKPENICSCFLTHPSQFDILQYSLVSWGADAIRSSWFGLDATSWH
jgi:hypothetical protein